MGIVSHFENCRSPPVLIPRTECCDQSMRGLCARRGDDGSFTTRSMLAVP